LKRVLLDRLAERHDFPVPEGMVEAEFEGIWKSLEEERARAKEASAPDPEGNRSEEEIRAEYHAIAVRRVRLGLLLSEVGRRNNITVTAEELNRALGMELRKYPGQEKQMLELFRSHPRALDTLRAPIFEDKVIDFILEIAKVSDRDVSAKELMQEEMGQE
ncbi:MAG TPA: trigger factor, partial [Stellaceae bacterium]|nr:trigger factor [Stellaceae bacterium]